MVVDARVQAGAHVPPVRDLRTIEAEWLTGLMRVERVGKSRVEKQTNWMFPIEQTDGGLEDNPLMVFVEQGYQPAANTRRRLGNHRLLSKSPPSKKSLTRTACSFPVISCTASVSALTLAANIE